MIKSESETQTALHNLCNKYLMNIRSFVENRNFYNNKQFDESFMRQIEKKMGITKQRTRDFRYEFNTYLSVLNSSGEQFLFSTNLILKKALEEIIKDDMSNCHDGLGEKTIPTELGKSGKI